MYFDTIDESYTPTSCNVFIRLYTVSVISNQHLQNAHFCTHTYTTNDTCSKRIFSLNLNVTQILTFLALCSSSVSTLYDRVISVNTPLLNTSGAGNNSCKLFRINTGQGLLLTCNLSDFCKYGFGWPVRTRYRLYIYIYI